MQGEYDSLKAKYRFLVTGSARLDVFRKGGDLLQGRYHYYRLHPFSVAELSDIAEAKLYLWDWAEIQDKCPQFENCLASHLLKLVHFLEDYEGYQCRLHYLRSIEKKEAASTFFRMEFGWYQRINFLPGWFDIVHSKPSTRIIYYFFPAQNPPTL